MKKGNVKALLPIGIKTDTIRNINANSLISDVPNPGINKVSSSKTIQQIAYIAMQKMYFDETIAFRENGVAHSNVVAFGN